MSILSEAVTRLLLAPALMVAAATLVKGYVDIGDGFSAGVIVGLAVAVQYQVMGSRRIEAEIPLLRHARVVAVAGALVALFAGFFPLFTGEAIFSHEPAPGVSPVLIGTLELMTPVLFDFGIFLIVSGSLIALIHYLAAPPRPQEGERKP